MKKTLLISLFLLVGTVLFAQKVAKTETIIIQTSAQCGDCKERIESKLNYTKGVKFAELDLTTMKVTVKFTTNKIDSQKIKSIIAKIGYDADEVKALESDVKKLPMCCQPGGMEHKN